MLIKSSTNWNLEIKHLFYETYLFIIFHIRKNLLTWDLLMLLLWSSAAICIPATIFSIRKNVLFGRYEVLLAWNTSSRVVLTCLVICSRLATNVFLEILLTSFSCAAEPISSHCFLCNCSVPNGRWSHFLCYIFWGKVCLLAMWWFNDKNLSISSFPFLLHVKIAQYKWLIIACAQFSIINEQRYLFHLCQAISKSSVSWVLTL